MRGISYLPRPPRTRHPARGDRVQHALDPCGFRRHLSPMPLPAPAPVTLPFPVAAAAGTGVAVRIGSRPLETHDAASALDMLAAAPHVLCHAAYLIERLGY